MTPGPNPLPVATDPFLQFSLTDVLQAAVAVLAVLIAVLAYRASAAATRIANNTLQAERERNAKAERREFVTVLRQLFGDRLEEVRAGVDENKPLYAYEERGRAASLESPGGKQIIDWMEATFAELVKWPKGTFRGYYVLATKSMFEMRSAAWIKDPEAFDPRPLDVESDIKALAQEIEDSAAPTKGSTP